MHACIHVYFQGKEGGREGGKVGRRVDMCGFPLGCRAMTMRVAEINIHNVHLLFLLVLALT